MKRRFVAAAFMMAAFCLSGCSMFVKTTQSSIGAQNQVQSEKEKLEDESGLDEDSYTCEIQVKEYGTITLELDAVSAPITVENFITLAEDGFYDGLTFHRIMEGFMMQGGCPEGTGYGGSYKTIKGEFESNGVKNPISHVRGTISMARSGDPDSASSQFFIVHEDSTFLDGQYAAFGHVTEGMDVVDQICADAEPVDNNGKIPAEEQPVIESIKILED